MKLILSVGDHDVQDPAGSACQGERCTVESHCQSPAGRNCDDQLRNDRFSVADDREIELTVNLQICVLADDPGVEIE